ncbi:MAG: GntR family transcriptional regulator [Candidatus Dormibacteraeota bacterium]|nr:GntR family transcriptional regulator [Candidatus Dormibacteraeota bacterium]
MGERSVVGASKLEFAYKTILSDILQGTYGPGYRLVIDELARELNMSQVPVREAIRRLEAEGWVTFERYVGARVAPADPARLEHLMQLLAVLEGAAAAFAATLLQEDDLMGLRTLDKAMTAALHVGNLLAFSRLNREFHERLSARCPNPMLVSMAQDVWRRLDVGVRSGFVYLPDRPRDAIAEHERIVDLLEQRAPAAEIEHAVREHKLATLRAIQRSRGANLHR